MKYASTRKLLHFSFAYTLFIVYGSLVPFDYRPIPSDQAWHAFLHIRYLNLGAASRADWIANIILYIPLTFSLSAYLKNKLRSAFLTAFFALSILAFSLTLAVTIEFTQQFFPPRTVSLNDLIAETLGSVGGMIIGFSHGKRFLRLWQQLWTGGREAFMAIATFYVVSFFAVSLFPYDFVTSFQELQDKLASGTTGLVFSAGCDATLRCAVNLMVEILTALPLGIFFSVMLKWHPQRSTAIMLIGFIFGIVIETVQVFLVSGVAQGISVVTRVIGMGLGERIYRKYQLRTTIFPVFDARKPIVVLSIPYLLLLASLNGWSLSGLEFTANIADKAATVRWLPFYYHYYTTESAALSSLLSITLMYLPVGLGMWLWNRSADRPLPLLNKMTAGISATALAGVMEFGKLFLAQKHPDPTNMLIGFAAAYLAYSLADIMYRWLHQTNDERTPLPEVTRDGNTVEPEPHAEPPPLQTTVHPAARIVAVLVGLVLVWKLFDYPGSTAGLGALVMLLAVVIYQYSGAWLFIVPALLPVSNLAPWTGRLFFTEFDFLILTVLTVSYWRGRVLSPFTTIPLPANLLLIFFGSCYLVSLAIGLFPLAPWDANAFVNYYSHYNSVRIGKGFLWTLGLLPIVCFNLANATRARRLFGYGIVAGLSLTAFFALWERAKFSGLTNFENDFRITSTFYSMHTGGAHLDAFMLLAMPFIAQLVVDRGGHSGRAMLALGVFTMSLYTLLVTFSRGSYIAFALALVVLLAGLTVARKGHIEKDRSKLIWLAVCLILGTAMALPVLKGTFIQQRFNQSGAEADIRSSHWLNAVAMMDNDPLSYLFGMGLGSFPRTYFWKSMDNATPATYAIHQTADGSFLRLRGGAPLYIEQQAAIRTGTAYRLQFNYRSASDKNALHVQLCEKAVHHSFSCRGFDFGQKQQVSGWQHFSQTFNSGNLGKPMNNLPAMLVARPVKLVFNYADPANTVDLTDIQLNSADTTNLIQNGDFSKGFDHWFFTTDVLIPWRCENQWIQLLFEQGWLGLVGFTLLMLYVIVQLFRQIADHQLFATVVLSSMTGFSIVSIANSPFDDPSIALLFYLLILLSFPALKPAPTSERRNKPIR